MSIHHRVANRMLQPSIVVLTSVLAVSVTLSRGAQAQPAPGEALSPAVADPPAPEFRRQADQDLPAREREALVACETGEFKRGIDILARLYSETLDTAYVFNQARCYQKSNLPQEAYGKFKEYLRVTREPEGELAGRARAYIKEHDDEEAERRRQEANLSPRTLRTMALIAGGVGVLGIGGGVFFALRMQAKADAIDGRLKQDPFVEESALADDRAAGQRFETLQYVSYGIGVAALVTGGVFYYLAVTRDGQGKPPREVAGAGTALAPSLLLGSGVLGAGVTRAF